MADVRAPPPPGQDERDECLHCAIVDMVEERIAAGGADVGDLATLIAEILVDLILLVPESEQAKLLAHTVSALGEPSPASQELGQGVGPPPAKLPQLRSLRPSSHNDPFEMYALIARFARTARRGCGSL
jgi:hypothetical protein